LNFSSEWYTLRREAELAGEQIASGVTALGRATHANTGAYTQAFFALSIGFERLAKLITVGEHVLTTGQFPSDDVLRRFGHRIDKLLSECELISVRRRAGGEYAERPDSPIHRGIVDTLSEFGHLTRYYNLDLIAGGKAGQLLEPLNAWWTRVGRPILALHHAQNQKEKDQKRAAKMAALITPAYVHHIDEEGKLIDDVETLTRRAGATRIVQRYGRLYTLQIVRWLSFLLVAISKHEGTLLGLEDSFVIFMNNDAFLRDRKTWSIYKR
jgi:hypothetical protein